MKRRILLTSLAVLLAISGLVAIGCPPAVVVEPLAVFVYASGFEAPSLDPGWTASRTAQILIHMALERLVRFDYGTHDLVGNLAERWEASEDLMTYTFHLRRGIYFTDGAPFNAEAVKINMDRTLALGGPPAGRFGGVIKEVNVIDTYTVEFVLHMPDAMLPYRLAGTVGFSIMSPKALAEHATADDPWAREWAHENLVGTGPYKLYKRIPGVRTVFVRNEDYWGGWGERWLDKVVIEVHPEYTTRRMLLEKGEAHLIMSVSVEDIPALDAVPGIEVLTIPTINAMYVFFNMDEPVMQSKYLRTALSWAFPYKELIEVWGGGAQLRGPLHRAIHGHYDEVFMFHTDLDKASEYLEKAGFQPGELKLVFVGQIGRPEGELMLANFAKIGVELELREKIWPAFSGWASGLDKEGVHLFYAPIWADFPGPMNVLDVAFYHTDDVLPVFPRGWISETLNAMLLEARMTPSIDRRYELYRQAQHLITDAVVNIHGFEFVGHHAISERVGGLILAPGVDYRVWPFHLMYFRDDA